jgi:hypothetical protein
MYFNDWGTRMTRTVFIAFIFTILACRTRLYAQSASVQDSADLKMELRSASGASRFQIGEIIPVKVLISSSAPNRYLEPCELFAESCFGFPQCRFFTHWAFDVSPASGWTDIGFHGCGAMSGPTFEVKSLDLTMEPKVYTYTLTNRFRFDTPGKYTVRLSLMVGLDDDSNQIAQRNDPKAEHHSVSKTTELVLDIVSAEGEWKKDVLSRGIAAWTETPLAQTNPPSPAFLKRQQEMDAFCNLGTPEAAIAAVGLLSRGADTRHCIEINPNKAAAAAEFGRLLVSPDVGVSPTFFNEYARLLSKREAPSGEGSAITPPVVTAIRETLFTSLSKKTPEAMAVSLDTVLRNPTYGYWVTPGSPYSLHESYSRDVIAMAAENFTRLSQDTRASLLDREWDHVRSPLMLPVVRREAQKGDGNALLRWQELDPVAATAFMRKEVVQSAPRFSSLYIRLPDKSLPAEEQQQLAANFVALSSPQELITEATLLHRYATSATLSTVLPFIDQHLAGWPCEVQLPVLAYLLKASPDDARTRLEDLLKAVRPPYCPRGQFFSSIGFIQAGPVLDSLAAKQIEGGTPLAEDAAMYLKTYGGLAIKPVVWEQLSRWHKKYVESEAEPHMRNGTAKQDEYQLGNLNSRLQEAFANAHGWTLSQGDAQRLTELMGSKTTEGLACNFSCGSPLSVGPGPGNYYVYGRVRDQVYPPDGRFDYLLSTEPYQYQINQYGCRGLESLEEKLLQFPKGSTFSFAHTGSGEDVGDWTAISAFLRNHGYIAGN